ncbi:uncharacterized protein LOC144007873 [Festucalex cinctus]
MQHDGTQSGLSSELFESLKLYLNNSNRLQPIIGLCSITECVKAGSRRGGEAVYLCEVCACRLSKGDMRNHIMGSLHRFNYTKSWHPHLLSDVKQSGADVSVMAWPLMEIARMLEDKEGPGDIKLLEVEEATFEMLKGASDSEAINLSKFLMYGPTEPKIHMNDNHEEDEENVDEDEEHRVVTVDHWKAQFADGDASSWAKESVLSFGHTLRDRYKGPKPLIGLFRVTECVCEEDGRTYCFLCHCCRTRVKTRAFYSHFSSSGHLRSYLMETRREQMEAAGPNVGNNAQMMAGKVEREEGRGEMEVVKVPQFFCGQLATESYKWCVTRLRKRGSPTVHKWTKAQKGVAKVKKRAEGVQSRVVFKVSLPLTEGPLLLERTSFSHDSPPLESLDPDFDCEPANPGEDATKEDLSAAHYFDPPDNRQGEHTVPDPHAEWQTEAPAVAREWVNSDYAQWHDWSPAPILKRENPQQAIPPPPDAIKPAAHHVPPTEFQSIPVVQTPSWTLPFELGPGGFPGYQGYGAPAWLHPPPYFIPPGSHPAASALPGPL